MPNLASMAQAEMTAAALEKMTGARPSIIYAGDHIDLKWTGTELAKARAWMIQTATAAPGAVRIDFVPVVTPLVLSTALPFLLAAMGAAYMIGRKVK